MAKFTFDKCCFCIELRSGCLIIGYLQLIGAIIGTIVLILALIAGGALTAYHAPDESRSPSSSFSFNINGNEYSPYGHKSSSEQNKEIEDAVHMAGVITMVISGITLLFVVIALAFVITLLVGLHNGKRGHIKAYLIYGFIFLVITIIMWFAGFAQRPINVGNVVGNLIGILLNLYFLLVIRSHYYELSDTSKGPAIYSAP